jgi:hypothetical protein
MPFPFREVAEAARRRPRPVNAEEQVEDESPRTDRALKDLEHALLRHVFEQREQGINVHTFDLVVKASSLSPEFNAKHFVARCSAVK